MPRVRPTVDLGTYHVIVELIDGRGWIQEWSTGRRFTAGTESLSPLSAIEIHPTWESEEDLFHAMIYQYTEGNYSCDCNKQMFIAQAAQKEPDDDGKCGDEILLRKLTVIRPNGERVPLWQYDAVSEHE